MTSELGQLTGWQGAQSQSGDGLQTRLYEVTFEYGSLSVTIAMNGAGEVDPLWFSMVRTKSSEKTRSIFLLGHHRKREFLSIVSRIGTVGILRR
jgi:hypothetical protein